MRKIFAAATVTAAAAVISTFAGCSRSAPAPEKQTVSQADAARLHEEAERLRRMGRRDEAVTRDREAADRLARIGELLLMPEGVEYADQMFAQALALDPTNAKALFYKAGTEPVMALKGFLPRIERLVVSDQDNKALEKFREDVAKLKLPEVSRFVNELPEGERPFVAYYDVQRFQRERMLPALQASLDRLNRIDVSQKPLHLGFVAERAKLDPARRSYTYYESDTTCSYDGVSGWSCTYYTYSGGYSESPLPKEEFVDQYDMRIIRASVASMIDAIRLGTAYSFKDSEQALRKLKAIDALRKDDGLPGVTAQDVSGTLREFHDLLALEADQQLTEMAESTARSLRDALELASLKQQLCDGHSRDASNSIIWPICISVETVDALQTGADMLAGPKEVEIGKDLGGNPVKIVIDLTRELRNPVKDLKTLLPATFDSQGDAVNYPDPTMGGVFPNGDLIDKLKRLGNAGKIHVMRDLRRAVNDAAKHL